MTEEMGVYMTAPTKNGEAPLPRRNGPKGLLPSTWLQRTLRVQYVAGFAVLVLDDRQHGPGDVVRVLRLDRLINHRCLLTP